jgi:hypothetical protein
MTLSGGNWKNLKVVARTENSGRELWDISFENLDFIKLRERTLKLSTKASLNKGNCLGEENHGKVGEENMIEEHFMHI